jgi:hypothetical protein
MLVALPYYTAFNECSEAYFGNLPIIDNRGPVFGVRLVSEHSTEGSPRHPAEPRRGYGGGFGLAVTGRDLNQ